VLRRVGEHLRDHVVGAHLDRLGKPAVDPHVEFHRDGWAQPSSRSFCSASALAIAIPASSVNSAIRDSVPAGKSSREVAATATPQ
jgi:hypothetical protein